MAMHPFAYANANSLEEAAANLDGETRPLAGGTDLVALMKDGLVAPKRLVNLKTVPGLAGVVAHADGLHIGALTTLSNLASNPELQERRDLAALVEALEESATPQLRHTATIGGNLLQWPRCWYFRNPQVPCWRKGGRRCFAFQGENKYHTIFGGGPCFAPHPSDPSVALMALDASVLVVGPQDRDHRNGFRVVPLAEFFVLPRRDHEWADGYHPVTLLETDEIVAAVVVPQAADGARSAFVKVMERGAWDFALVSAAVSLTMDGNRVAASRVVLGGVAPIPWRANQAEAALRGERVSEDGVARAVRAAVADARPLGHNEYKVALAKQALAQAFRALA
ncbi:MAG: FAD binding domain-containing protein [Anaerolineae bacterium]|nr:FAD binding domain-containing protein [Anaerolineae bacterium]